MPPSTGTASQESDTRELDAVVVGAGFAGLYMLHSLRQQGLEARIFEAGSGAGGTWFWNRYPGARVDIESMQYSYQFSDELQQEWQWRERYAPQAELLDYVAHVIERFDLAGDIQFDTRVESAIYDASRRRWRVSTNQGDTLSTRYCIMATGCLSTANIPDIPGRENFVGPLYHTGQWPHEAVDFSGKRVGIIGTGSSGIQAIPVIARQAAQLTVFQRTPNYAIPAYNQALDPEYVKETKAHYPALRAAGKQQANAFDVQANDRLASEMSAEEISAELEQRWRMGGLNFYGCFADLMISRQANDIAARFVREKIAARVDDPATAELLSPKTVIGAKRICVDTDYFETYNRDNVTLVDISQTPITEITARGLRVGDQDYEFDALVFATGFDAMTGALNAIDIQGRGGVKLKDKWQAGPRTYLGLCSAGFPNLFTISGPGSPSVFTNMITSIEQHVEYIRDIIVFLRERGLSTIEADVAAEDAWVDHVNDVARETLVYEANSWYLGANIPGKPRVFMPYIGGFPLYVEKCDTVVARGYEGFTLS